MAHVAGAVALVAVAAAALIVGGTFTLLRTSWGSDLARRIGLHFANRQLAGRLEVKRLRFSGDHLYLENVVLRDPRGGAVVARVGRLDVGFRPFALLRGHVDLTRVAIDGPQLHLVLDPGGSNLSRAVAARAPSPTEASSPSTFELSVGQLDLARGLFDLRQRGAPAGAPLAHLRASNVGARIAGRLSVATWEFQGKVSINARVEAPAAVPLSLEANATGDGDQRTGAVTLTLGGGALDVTASTHRDARGALAASAHVRRLHVPPGLVRAVLPDVPLAAPLDATLNAALDGAALRADARVTAGGGVLTLRGAADLARAALRELKVDGHDVDLGRVVEGLPRSSLSFELRAHGAGRTLRTATGEASFATPGGLLGGYALGPIRVRARAARGGVELAELRAVLPGATVTAKGWARKGAVDLRASLEAADLGKTARSLGPALAPLGLAGRGHLALRATGSIDHPAVGVKGRFPALAMKGVSMRDIALNADVTGPRMTADVRMAAPQPLSLHLDGRIALTRGVAVDLDAFELAYPEARWRLAAPTRIVVRPELVLIDGLALRADGQAIDAHVRAPRNAPIDARIAVSALDLARLPRVAQPRGHALGGRLDLKARITGTRRRPAARAHVSLANGRVGAARDLTLSLDLEASRARLAGGFTARGFSTSARGEFDVPAAWPVRESREPVAIDLQLAPTDLAAISKELRLPGPSLAGKVALSLRVTGTASAPQARLDVTTQALVASGVALGDPRLSFSASRGAPTRLQIDVQPGAAGASTLAGTVAIETPTPLERLLHDASSLEALLRMTFSARGALGGVPLAPLARALRLEAPVRGTASVRLTAQGTPRAPTGALNVMVHGAASDTFPPTDARLDLALGERDTRLAARAWRQGQASRPLAAASATWGTTLARVLAGPAAFRAAAAEAPLEVRVFAGPGEVKHKTYLPFETTGPADDLRARARLTATVTGTLSRPVADVTAEVSEAHLGNQHAGRALVRLHYADAQAKLTATASSAGGGTLRLQAATRADLGYPRGLAALVPDQLPLEATAEARAFDLAWLGGLTDGVRRVSGKLDANVRVAGSLGAPIFGGRLEWKNGGVTITEVGEYHDVHVALHADQGTISIDDLRASSRGGTAHVTGKMKRAPGDHLDVTARANLKRFPIYAQGDVMGTLSTRLDLRANASRLGAKAHIDVEEAKAELGEIRRKDVQSLDRPANVVLVAGGRPIDKGEARKLKALEAERRAHAVANGQAADAAGPVASVAEPEPAPWNAEVEIAAPRRIWVSGDEVDLELGLGAGFKVDTSPELRIEGSVVVRRGTVNVLGRKFTLQKGSTVTFKGPPDSLRLDVVAEHVNERSKVTVLVTIRGTPDDPKVDVTSPDRPDLNQTQLYGLIITGQLDAGQRSATGTSSFSNEAATLVGGLLASSIQKTLKKRLPLDVLTIQAGTGITGSRLEAGTYLGSRLYVGYVGRVGSDPILLQNRNAVRVEYQFTPRWSLDAEYGDVGTGTADVLWNKHY